MNVLQTINLENIPEHVYEKFEKRTTARAVIFDSDDKVAIMFVSKIGIYMTPGGGLDGSETLEKGLRRECREEAGCNIQDIQEQGVIVSHRTGQIERTEICHIFTARVDGEKMEPIYMEDEIEEGTELHWYSIDEAIEKVNSYSPTNNNYASFQQRELFHLHLTKDNL